MDPRIEQQLLQTRRQFFGDAGLRLGRVALAMLMGTMKAPIAKFVRTLAEPTAKFVRTVKAVADKQAA